MTNEELLSLIEQYGEVMDDRGYYYAKEYEDSYDRKVNEAKELFSEIKKALTERSSGV